MVFIVDDDHVSPVTGVSVAVEKSSYAFPAAVWYRRAGSHVWQPYDARMEFVIAGPEVVSVHHWQVDTSDAEMVRRLDIAASRLGSTPALHYPGDSRVNDQRR